ncbi:MAG TPA: hypothetical protein VFY06_14905 [Verrucomicrobiae bacterium]|nr:hypothetical protein [Verrucomicrobiae bacterium]
MPIEVSDKISNLNDQLANAAKILGRSTHRQKVFEAIYRGKKQVKTQNDIRRTTKLPPVRILQEGGKLAGNHIVEQFKVDGLIAYKKVGFYSLHKAKILRLARDSKKLASFPTKINPKPSSSGLVTVKYHSKAFDVVDIALDDVDNFSKIKKQSHGQQIKPVNEKQFKEGVKKIIGETGKFTDWGGEKNDLFTTRIRIRGKRLPCAFAFKGKGKKGILKPKDFGKNGDQIPRLFQTDAQVFVLQYWGQVDPSVYELMRNLAIARSALNRQRVYFAVADGDDTQRLIKAYPGCF